MEWGFILFLFFASAILVETSSLTDRAVGCLVIQKEYEFPTGAEIPTLEELVFLANFSSLAYSVCKNPSVFSINTEDGSDMVAIGFHFPLSQKTVVAFKGSEQGMVILSDGVDDTTSFLCAYPDFRMDTEMFYCCDCTQKCYNKAPAGKYPCTSNFFGVKSCDFNLRVKYALSNYNNGWAYLKWAENAVAKLKNKFKVSTSDIVLTGHSLGGALAALIGAKEGIRAIAFGSPGEAYYGNLISYVDDPSAKTVFHFIHRYDRLSSPECYTLKLAPSARRHNGNVYLTQSTKGWTCDLDPKRKDADKCQAILDSKKSRRNSVAATWMCPAPYYNASDGCDCGCGAPDPDCVGGTSPQGIFGCEGFIQSSVLCLNATCSGPLIPTPSGWTCDPAFYNASDSCDCNCGIYDPDCATQGANVFGCEPGVNCTSKGTCAPVPTVAVPSAWTCDKTYYAANDGCDCNCGAPDPDCTDPAQQVYNCLCGKQTCVSGACAGPCDVAKELSSEVVVQINLGIAAFALWIVTFFLLSIVGAVWVFRRFRGSGGSNDFGMK